MAAEWQLRDGDAPVKDMATVHSEHWWQLVDGREHQNPIALPMVCSTGN